MRSKINTILSIRSCCRMSQQTILFCAVVFVYSMADFANGQVGINVDFHVGHWTVNLRHLTVNLRHLCDWLNVTSCLDPLGRIPAVKRIGAMEKETKRVENRKSIKVEEGKGRELQ